MSQLLQENIDIIGDIHGHHEELCKLLETLGYLFEGNKLIHPDYFSGMADIFKKLK